MKDINVKRGWVYFFFGLSLSFYSGLYLRWNYSSEEVTRQVRFHLHGRLKNVDFQFQKVHLKLSEGWKPTLRFVFEGISVTALKKCKYPYSLQVRSLELPVSFRHLIKKDLKFSEAKISSLHLLPLVSEECVDREVSEESTGKSEGLQPMEEKIEEGWGKIRPAIEGFQAYAKERIKKEIENLELWMGELVIDEVLIETPKGLHSRIKNLEIEFLKGVASGAADWQIAPRLLGKQPLKNIAFSFNLDEKRLQVDFQGLYKEGRLYFQSQLDLVNLSSRANLKLNNIPVDSLSKLYVKKEDLLQDSNFNWSWLNCEISHNKQVFAGFLDEAVQISECNITGKEIEISIPHQDIFLSPSRFALKLNINKLPIKNTMLLLNQRLPLGVFKDTGQLSGSMLISGEQNVEFAGQLKGLEFFFTNKGKRAKQVINSLDLSLNKESNRFSGKISGLKLDRGAFLGQVTFNLSQTLDEGVFQFAVENIDLHPTVDNVIMDGEIEGLGLFGKGVVLNSRLEALEGELGALKMSTDQWTLGNLKSKIGYMKNQPLDLSLSLGILKLDQESTLFAPLSSLRVLSSENQIQLLDIIGSFKVSEEGGEWRSLSFSVEDKKVLAASDGRWLKGGEVRGELFLDLPNKKMMFWEVSGLLKEPYLTPSQKLMEDLRKSIPEITESNIATPVDRLSTYKSSWEQIKTLFF